MSSRRETDRGWQGGAAGGESAQLARLSGQVDRVVPYGGHAQLITVSELASQSPITSGLIVSSFG